jgi:hypothetical protein
MGVDTRGKTGRRVEVHVGRKGFNTGRDGGWTTTMKRIKRDGTGSRMNSRIQHVLEATVKKVGVVEKVIHMIGGG